MRMQMTLALDLEPPLATVDPAEIDEQITTVRMNIAEMDLPTLSVFYEDIVGNRYPATHGAPRYAWDAYKWLVRHDGRHHRRRALAAIRDAIAERTKGASR